MWNLLLIDNGDNIFFFFFFPFIEKGRRQAPSASLNWREHESTKKKIPRGIFFFFHYYFFSIFQQYLYYSFLLFIIFWKNKSSFENFFFFPSKMYDKHAPGFVLRIFLIAFSQRRNQIRYGIYFKNEQVRRPHKLMRHRLLKTNRWRKTSGAFAS